MSARAEPTSNRNATVAIGALLAAGLLWGLTWMPLKYFAAQGLTGITMTLCTYGVVGLCAIPLIFAQRHAWWPQRKLLLIIGVLGAVGNVCFVSALATGEVARAMLLFYLTPVWGVLGGRMFFREAITPLRITTMVMALAGALLVLGGPHVLAAKPSLNDVLAIAAGFSYASQNLGSRAANSIPMLSKTLSVFVGCLLIGAIAFLFSNHRFVPVTTTLTIQLLAFGFLWLIAAMWTTMYGVTHLEAGRAAVLVVFELVAAVVSAMVIGGERLDTLGWIGAALITGAALLEAKSTSA